MEKIIIKDFLLFKDIEMPINRFNLLIGEQASGKSLLAKLVYFFRGIGRKILTSCSEGLAYDDFVNNLSNDFVELFPVTYWNDKKGFCINYYYDNEEVCITIKSDRRKIIKHTFIFSNELLELYNECLKINFDYREDFLKLESENDDKFGIDSFAVKIDIRRKISKEMEKYPKLIDTVEFIPSSRSFFSVLEKNSFSLLTGNKLSIDPFMKNFGVTFQNMKNFYKSFVHRNSEVDSENMIRDYFYDILKGEYQEIDGEDWLVGKNYKVSFSRASSGQQEAFPLMLILSVMGGIKRRLALDLLFIEEPEAHLFPNAQSKVISVLLLLANKFDTNFFITTHSPYVLSALNNSVYANELMKRKKISVEEFINLSNGSYPIDFEDISAFAIEDGKLVDIKDNEYKMIGGDILDSISNEFGQVMDQLMELDN